MDFTKEKKKCDLFNTCKPDKLQAEKEEADPRSFCYNILSKPEHVCKPGKCITNIDKKEQGRFESDKWLRDYDKTYSDLEPLIDEKRITCISKIHEESKSLTNKEKAEDATYEKENEDKDNDEDKDDTLLTKSTTQKSKELNLTKSEAELQKFEKEERAKKIAELQNKLFETETEKFRKFFDLLDPNLGGNQELDKKTLVALFQSELGNQVTDLIALLINLPKGLDILFKSGLKNIEDFQRILESLRIKDVNIHVIKVLQSLLAKGQDGLLAIMKGMGVLDQDSFNEKGTFVCKCCKCFPCKCDAAKLELLKKLERIGKQRRKKEISEKLTKEDIQKIKEGVLTWDYQWSFDSIRALTEHMWEETKKVTRKSEAKRMVFEKKVYKSVEPETKRLFEVKQSDESSIDTTFLELPAQLPMPSEYLSAAGNKRYDPNFHLKMTDSVPIDYDQRKTSQPIYLQNTQSLMDSKQFNKNDRRKLSSVEIVSKDTDAYFFNLQQMPQSVDTAKVHSEPLIKISKKALSYSEHLLKTALPKTHLIKDVHSKIYPIKQTLPSTEIPIKMSEIAKCFVDNLESIHDLPSLKEIKIKKRSSSVQLVEPENMPEKINSLDITNITEKLVEEFLLPSPRSLSAIKTKKSIPPSSEKKPITETEEKAKKTSKSHFLQNQTSSLPIIKKDVGLKKLKTSGVDLNLTELSKRVKEFRRSSLAPQYSSISTSKKANIFEKDYDLMQSENEIIEIFHRKSESKAISNILTKKSVTLTHYQAKIPEGIVPLPSIIPVRSEVNKLPILQGVKDSTNELSTDLFQDISAKMISLPPLIAPGSKRSHSESPSRSTISTSLHESARIAVGLIFKADSCPCFPGFCTCENIHYLFRKEEIGSEWAQKIIRKPTFDPDILPAVWRSEQCICCKLCEKHTVEKLEPMHFIYKKDVLPKQTISFKSIPVDYERTVVIIKPEAVCYKDAVYRAIKTSGLDVVNERTLKMSPEQIAEVYAEQIGSPYFAQFVENMSLKPLTVLSVGGEDAIFRWRQMIGPENKLPAAWFFPASMRRRFGLNEPLDQSVFGSANKQHATRQSSYFFPYDILDPVIADLKIVRDYCDKYICPTLIKGLLEILKERPVDPVKYLAENLLIRNPFQPKFPKNVALAPI